MSDESNSLNEAKIDSLDELMSRDPLSLRLAPHLIAEQVSRLRSQRAKWEASLAEGKKVRNKKAKKEPS